MRFRVVRATFAPIFFSVAFVFLGIISPIVSNPMMAQTNTTGLSGVITDPTGAVVPDTAIELSNPATGFLRVIKSSSKGEYTFDQILPGRYHVTISAELCSTNRGG